MSTASAYRSYIGATTTTLLPLAANAAGKAPHTSPKPPVLDHGETSAVTKTIGMPSFTARVCLSKERSSSPRSDASRPTEVKRPRTASSARSRT